METRGFCFNFKTGNNIEARPYAFSRAKAPRQQLPVAKKPASLLGSSYTAVALTASSPPAES
jgi:hypothetical protein